MTTLSIASVFTSQRRLAVFGTLGFAIALAAGAQIAIPLPGTPVPITLQPLIVVLAGMMLGPALGAASMALYLVAGIAGLPVYSPFGAPGIARLLGPTGGFLLAFPAAACAAGWLARTMPTLLGRWAAAIIGMAVLFAGGIAQLTVLSGSFSVAVAQGITPFAAFDVIKAFVAAIITRPRARRPNG